MKLNINPGKYIVAVSGGVDSIVLLDVLSKQKDMLLIIAHFDHGIRANSRDDRIFVQKLAKQYGYPFEFAEGKLGASTSEATAREARYTFLHSVKEKYDADAIITAHHQDDVLETLIINLLRGTGRKGLSSLQSRNEIVRPLLNVSKADLIAYAEEHRLVWQEDETNQDEAYLRNWVRKQIMPKLTKQQREDLLSVQANASRINATTDSLLDLFLDSFNPQELSKKIVLALPHNVSIELIAHWLRSNNVRDIDSKMLERILLGAKTLKKNSKIPVSKNTYIEINKESISLHI